MMMNTGTKINPDQARALAFLIAGIRPDWDQQGTYAAISRAKDMGTLTEVTLAAIKAAQNPTNRTPAVIHMQGAHWTTQTASTTPLPSTVAACPIHDIRPGHNCHCCRSEWLVSGTWPEGTLHSQAMAAPVEVEHTPDYRQRAAGDTDREDGVA